MEALELIVKTREYLNYLEKHILNVEKAFEEVKIKCKDMEFISDPVFLKRLSQDVKKHDLSKFSKEEFTQYRKVFYPALCETDKDLGDAWEHHKSFNSHHWENWTADTSAKWHAEDWKVDCAHMIIDWIAMSYKFGGTAQQYYEKNKITINIPKETIDFMYSIFQRVYGE